MDLTLTPAQLDFRDELRGWLDEHHPGSAPSGFEAEFRFRRDWQRRLHDGRWAAVSWPEEYGGRGATLVEQAILSEETARARVPRPANTVGLSMAGPTVIARGSDEQKRRFLPGILSAEEIWCQGFSEPESGSDLASLKTRAVRDGEEWVISGQKVWTSFAQHAKWCILLARTDPDASRHLGITYFIMDMEQEGIEIRPLVQITGEAEFNEMFIDGARIPDENVVGGVGNGWTAAITTLMHERATLPFNLMATLRVALGELVDEIGVAVGPDGRPLSGDPVVRQRLGQLMTEVEVMRLNAYRGLTAIIAKGVPGPEGSLGKWHWSEINQALTEFALDVRGPQAFLGDDEWTYRFLRARANSIEGGTTEILKNIVAERVLGLARSR